MALMNAGDASYHIEKIKAVLENRRKRNPGYSLRSYARDLELSPSALSALLNGKKGISKEKAEIVAQKIGLGHMEQKVFILSVVSEHGRSPENRKQATERLHYLTKRNSSAYQASTEMISDLESWHDFAVLEAMGLETCKHTVEWFAERLHLTKEEVERVLQRLERYGRISFENGKYHLLFPETTTEFDKPNEAIKAYHSDLLVAAQEALYNQPVDQREFLNLTMAFNQSDLQEAKNFIRDFQDQFTEKFYSKQKTKDSIYQLSIQLFRLDEEK